LKKPGDEVAVGDVLAEVETDKADMELEAENEGVLSEVLVQEGGSVSVGQVIARLAAAGEAVETRAHRAEAPAAGKAAPPPAAHPAPPSAKAHVARVVEKEQSEERNPRIAKRDLGPRRIVPPPGPAPRPASAPPQRHPASTTPPSGGREALSKIRRTVARRMAESKREVPHFYMTAEIDMTECVRLKTSLTSARPEASISYTHLLLRAVALALGDHPRINARFAGEDAIEFSNGIHLGIAVALDEGLIVPVLHDCQSKSVFEIAAEARALVERVRSGKAEGGDLSGGTFTVSNLGMYPIEEFAAVINPPQAAVLAVGSLRERPAAREGAVIACQTMRVTLSSDHRVIDGAEAAQFLETLKALLENPVRLVI